MSRPPTPVTWSAPAAVRTELPNLNRERLENRAQRHADDIAMERGWGDTNCSIDQLVVNMLRHEYTDYDNDQTAARHTAANRAIAARYPWLAAECDRQTERRTAEERDSAALWADHLAMQEQIALMRQETIAASRAICGSFHVGQPVELTIKGHQRSGTVVKVGRSRLTVHYEIKTGAERTAVVYATEVKILSQADTHVPLGHGSPNKDE